jgi:molybdopterin-guanine dinucleotide biosynthesis protein B
MEFRNIEDDSKALGMSNNTMLLAVCGFKKTGKSSLIVSLLPLLAERGIKTAVIKHDAHSFTPDTPGTDSFRYFQAGAFGSAVYDSEKFSISKRTPVTERELIGLFPDADLIILEGFKYSSYPKIEIVRSGISSEPVSDPATCIALVSDLDLDTDLTVFHPDATDDIAAFIASFVRKGHK